MKRRVTIALASLALLLHGADASTSSSGDALDAGLADDSRLAGPPGISSTPAALPLTTAEPVTTVRVVARPAAPVRVLSANPLWAVPLMQLSGTRDRPIFSASRRPPSVAVAAEPAVVQPPPRKKEIETPQLSLVGTIASDDEGFGIFIDQSTKTALRLKIGEDYQGWKLRAIRGREVTMAKDQQAAVLTLPQPGGAQSSGEVQLLPVRDVKRR
jgi:hypothetical protein